MVKTMAFMSWFEILHISVAQILSEIQYEIQRKRLLKNAFQTFSFKNNEVFPSKTHHFEDQKIKIA